MKKKQLEVGDEVVGITSGFAGSSLYDFYIIDRVTQTQAIAGSLRFKRELEKEFMGDGCRVREFGNTYSRTSWLVATDKHRKAAEEANRRRVAIRRIEDIRWRDQNLDTLEAVCEALDKFPS